MTRDEILAMDPGRELDALVAEKVMGWMDVDLFDLKDSDGTNIVNGVSPQGYASRVKHYSTDISAAWEVVEKMKKTGVADINAFSYGLYSVSFTDLNNRNKTEANRYEGDSLCEAICKAALLAVMEA